MFTLRLFIIILNLSLNLYNKYFSCVFHEQKILVPGFMHKNKFSYSGYMHENKFSTNCQLKVYYT